MCVASWSGGSVRSTAATTTEAVRARAERPPAEELTFRVDAWRRNVGSDSAEWVIRQDPTSDDRVPLFNRVEFQGWDPGTSVFGRNPSIRVRYVHQFWGDCHRLVGRDAARRKRASPGAGQLARHELRGRIRSGPQQR